METARIPAGFARPCRATAYPGTSGPGFRRAGPIRGRPGPFRAFSRDGQSGRAMHNWQPLSNSIAHVIGQLRCYSVDRPIMRASHARDRGSNPLSSIPFRDLSLILIFLRFRQSFLQHFILHRRGIRQLKISRVSTYQVNKIVQNHFGIETYNLSSSSH